MSYMQQTLFSLFIINTMLITSVAAQSNFPPKDPKIAPLYGSKNPKTNTPESKDESSEENSEEKNESFIFSEKDIVEMEMVFKSSPIEAQYIVNHLQDPTYFPMSENYRSAMFVGEPGTGKTTLAKAIIYKMSQKGWDYKFLLSPELLGEYRNGTARKLKKELKASVSSGKPIIIVVDELHRLLENSESKHHDTDSTAGALWTFLDTQKGNKNFFLIGTMNRSDKLPKPYKSRILFNCIDFPIMTDPTIQSQTFRTIFKNNNIKIDSQVTDAFLIEEFQKMGPSAGRYLENLAAQVCKITKMNNPQISGSMTIEKASISQAIHQFITLKSVLKYDLEEETDEQRQERHHQENINLQKEYHAEQRLLHKEDKERQELQTLEQLFLQIHQQYRSDRFQDPSDVHKQAFKEAMANVYAMKERVAEEKKAKETAAQNHNNSN